MQTHFIIDASCLRINSRDNFLTSLIFTARTDFSSCRTTHFQSTNYEIGKSAKFQWWLPLWWHLALNPHDKWAVRVNWTNKIAKKNYDKEFSQNVFRLFGSAAHESNLRLLRHYCNTDNGQYELVSIAPKNGCISHVANHKHFGMNIIAHFAFSDEIKCRQEKIGNEKWSEKTKKTHGKNTQWTNSKQTRAILVTVIMC